MVGTKLTANTIKAIAITFFACIALTCVPALAQEAGEVTVEKQPGINFLSLLFQGGWFMVPLAALSLAVVAIAIERCIVLRRDRVFPSKLVTHLGMLAQSPGGLDPREAYKLCQAHPSSASRIFRNTLVKVGRPHQEVENALKDAAQREATRMAQLGSWLSLAAAVAPLIGLLGTVWGITQAFHDTTNLPVGVDRAEALGEGIYTALVTTMVGLLIAIPSAVLAHYFENKVVNTTNDIEEMINNLLPQLERYEGQIRFTEGGSVATNGNRKKREGNLTIPEPESSATGR